jgi:hypothetical protein
MRLFEPARLGPLRLVVDGTADGRDAGGRSKRDGETSCMSS